MKLSCVPFDQLFLEGVDNEMIKLYDDVIVKSSGARGTVVETDDDGGMRPEIYLVELKDMPEDADIMDILIWCESDEIAPC